MPNVVCLVFGVLVFGVWCFVFGVCCLVVWCLLFGGLVFVVSCLLFGGLVFCVCCFVFWCLVFRVCWCMRNQEHRTRNTEQGTRNQEHRTRPFYYWFFPSTTSTNSPFSFLSFRLLASSCREPRMVSSYNLLISREMDARRSLPK